VTTGAVTRRFADPFGNQRGTAATWTSDHGYLNKPTSPLSGLAQLGARAYDAVLGRFLSVDPVLAPDNPQQNNGYSYSANNPITRSDPDGRCYSTSTDSLNLHTNCVGSVGSVAGNGAAYVAHGAPLAAGNSSGAYRAYRAKTGQIKPDIWRAQTPSLTSAQIAGAMSVMRQIQHAQTDLATGNIRGQSAAISQAASDVMDAGFNYCMAIPDDPYCFSLEAGSAFAGGAAKGLRAMDGVTKATKLSELFADGAPTASELIDYGTIQGWRLKQTETGPPTFYDENNVGRMVIKRGSERTPGSENPHVELKSAEGNRIDPDGNPVTRRSPGNHTPIIWDLP